jgi:hypothetical protein
VLKLFAVLCAAATSAWCGHIPKVRPGPAPLVVTVLLDFEEPHSDLTFKVLEIETAEVLRNAGVRLAWRLRSQVARGESFDRLVSFRVHGRCDMSWEPAGVGEGAGPLALAYAADGVVLPYGEIDCERVKASVARAMAQDPSPSRCANVLLGRALGRVLAHEMYHMLSNEVAHTESGITRKGLSPTDLTRPNAFMSKDAARDILRNTTPTSISRDSAEPTGQ